ncbi:LytR/AlgR family response regulator transcription factor [Arabiibacter massiliensis]|uniref:LytR/AlgR family response regulator transcription factor n=1 Tax=Arabiibacter massiliensis TaxID=1870985 RepID=UPI0009BA7736|nr:LytTR family DNA-binding domain-containing protein [Arabiibacter massiliensis]
MLAGVPLSVAIVEDDDEQADLLERMARRHPQADRLAIERFTSVAELARRAAAPVKPGEPALDVVFMDIRFEGEERTGIDIVAELFPAGCGTQVIYVTGYPEFCTKVYRTEHVYFLTKPVAEPDFNDALDKALQAIERDRGAAIGVTVGSRLVKVPPQRISYIESDRRKVRIYLVDGTVLESYAALGALAALLPGSFAQCHKSFIVNMTCVEQLEPDAVRLSSGEAVPLSRGRRREVKERFLSHLRACL